MSHYHKNKEQKKENFFSEKHRELFKAIFSLALAIILSLSLFNLSGLAGGYLSFGLKLIFGKIAFTFPFFLLVSSFLFFSKSIEPSVRLRVLLGISTLLISLASFFWLFEPNKIQSVTKIQATGGYVGFAVAFCLEKVFAFWGALVILAALFIFSIFLSLEEPLKGKVKFLFISLGKLSLAITLLIKKFLTAIFRKKDKPAQFSKKEIEGDNEFENNQREELISSKDKKENKGLLPLAFKRKIHQKVELPLDLLSYHEEKAEARNIDEGRHIIEKTLENFGIPVEMAEVQVGPTVTQYALRPKEGVKLSRITALSNDLALALAAHPIRIEAPIPGKSLVGIEVPNKKIAIVSLRELLESEGFKKRSSNLTIPLGKDVSNAIWLADIKKMPHLLISGATNSGKTIMIHSIITSLLYQNSPDDLRFILIDPKRVELNLYDGMPHLLTPVVNQHKQAINALYWAIGEMERRLDLFKENRARDIASFNEKSEIKLPYIVIIIDELADLMMSSSQDVEMPIVRLAQLARATGIHLILATQKPSVDIITGLIKSNITSRIAFSVASMVDSRTILDHPGAEKLIGRGDMLFILPEVSKPKRVQAPFVSDKETEKVIEFLKDKEPTDYITAITENKNGNGHENEFSIEEDSFLPEARDLVQRQDKASATLLQRYLKVGYARAARLLDLLEQEGTIGQADGARPREVLRKYQDEEIEETTENISEKETLNENTKDEEEKNESIAEDNEQD